MNDKRKTVFDVLDKLEIEYEVIEHPAVKTIDETDGLGIDFKGEILKNLFLCDDKRNRFFLVSVLKEKRINLKALKDKLSSRPLSFASEKRLNRMLGLEKGEVTPLGILNDKEQKIEVIFDDGIKSFERVGVHPNDNTATVLLSPADLEKIIKISGNTFSYLEF